MGFMWAINSNTAKKTREEGGFFFQVIAIGSDTLKLL